MNLFRLLLPFILISISLCQGEEELTAKYQSQWVSFPACRMGRLQSPIRLNVTESIYSSSFAIVYQSYKTINPKLDLEKFDVNKQYAIKSENLDGGYIHFQKGGVIKQYQLKRFELYKGLHYVDYNISEYELHIVFEKNLGYVSNKNQYRRIQDANNYLVIALRYNTNNGTTDNGLLSKLTKKEAPPNSKFNLGDFPIFQDKKAYFYEGSFIYNPCKEDVNYLVIEPIFKAGDSLSDVYSESKYDAFKHYSLAYERPIYRNYMNFTEALSSSYLKPFLSTFIGFVMLI